MGLGVGLDQKSRVKLLISNSVGFCLYGTCKYIVPQSHLGGGTMFVQVPGTARLSIPCPRREILLLSNSLCPFPGPVPIRRFTTGAPDRNFVRSRRPLVTTAGTPIPLYCDLHSRPPGNRPYFLLDITARRAILTSSGDSQLRHRSYWTPRRIERAMLAQIAASEVKSYYFQTARTGLSLPSPGVQS